ncbi:transmembrane protein, putative (macronuclear) [Tetrahymena thermophila SB210]|uniref:Transmembrane protein, putative n=1 Tax=Tetrahymena thermophila (strain SB210) TaxID=312017 RepID=W7XFG3_TETTS|nr:transmembrane protein, putative [Tetrahymena thermophila SB210]EWS71529.1 transmembrane protein, putative [Tetrahymena thermophila SB210]|eukprot:XP_012655940.1 transmembrane protein, putative [Tetrahymena thermophila SB210]
MRLCFTISVILEFKNILFKVYLLAHYLQYQDNLIKIIHKFPQLIMYYFDCDMNLILGFKNSKYFKAQNSHLFMIHLNFFHDNFMYFISPDHSKQVIIISTLNYFIINQKQLICFQRECLHFQKISSQKYMFFVIIFNQSFILIQTYFICFIPYNKIIVLRYQQSSILVAILEENDYQFFKFFMEYQSNHLYFRVVIDYQIPFQIPNLYQQQQGNHLLNYFNNSNLTNIFLLYFYQQKTKLLHFISILEQYYYSYFHQNLQILIITLINQHSSLICLQYINCNQISLLHSLNQNFKVPSFNFQDYYILYQLL